MAFCNGLTFHFHGPGGGGDGYAASSKKGAFLARSSRKVVLWEKSNDGDA